VFLSVTVMRLGYPAHLIADRVPQSGEAAG